MTNRVCTIKEIYNCATITSDEPLFPLQVWYNRMIEKTVDELDASDVLKMLRQNIFVDLAMKTAMHMLQEDVFSGELYDGEVLEKLSEINSEFLKPYADELKTVVHNASQACQAHVWGYDGEESEFRDILSKLSVKLL